MNLRRLAFHPQKMLPCWKEKHLQRVRNTIPTVPSSMSAFRVHQTKNMWMQPPKDPKAWRVTLTLQHNKKTKKLLLVVLNHGIFHVFHILGMSSSQLTNSFIFQRGSTTNQNWCFYSVQAQRTNGSMATVWEGTSNRLTPESHHHTPVVLPKARLDP